MKIIWAVDPFAANPKLASTVAFLKSWGAEANTGLVPTYVAGPGETRLSLAFDIPEAERYSLFPKNKLATLFQKMPDLKTAAAIVHVRAPSIGAMAEGLAKFAKKEKATMMAISKHNKTVMERFLVGSFTEAMISRATVPLLILHPQARIPTKVRTIVFATDFSDLSKRAMQATFAMAREVGARVILFHQIEPMYPVGFDIPTAGLGEIEEIRREQIGKEMDALVRKATKDGVKVKSALGENYGDAADHLLALADAEKADAIALASQSNRFTAVLLGSVARRVVRQSSLPVLLWRK